MDIDTAYEDSIRPRRFDEYIGQKDIVENLRVYVQAAKARGESLDHCLFHGPPGLGKTTLANIIAHELEVSIKVTSGPAIEQAGSLAAILTNLEDREVLFIDEIHRLNPIAEEKLYPAMEDYQLDVVIGQGPAARTVAIPLKKFTLIGATTKQGSLGKPFLDRFGIVERLNYYENEEIGTIVKRAAAIMNIRVEEEAVSLIALSSRCTPRTAHNNLRRTRDFAEVLGDGVITKEIAKTALTRLGIDSLGLGKPDRDYLKALIDTYGGRPIGLKTLALTLAEEEATIENVVEPYLIMKGYIKKTERGRVALPPAYKALGKANAIEELFD